MAKAPKFKNLTNKDLKALLPKDEGYKAVINQLIETINDGRYWMVSFFNGDKMIVFDSQGYTSDKEFLTQYPAFCVYSELESGEWNKDIYSLQGELMSSENGLYKKTTN